MVSLKKHRVLYVILLLLPAVLLFVGLYQTSKTGPDIKAGVLDLAAWDREARPTFRLTGEWELYPDLLLGKEQISGGHWSPIIIQIPVKFDTVDIVGQPVPAYSSATYRLHVVNAGQDQDIGIMIGQLTAAYHLYIDDQLIAANGSLEDNALASISDYTFQTAAFSPGKSSFDIILQTANQYDSRGFYQWPLEFGDDRQLFADGKVMSNINLITIGGLLTLSALILFFSLILPRKNELLNLCLFGLVTIIDVMLTRQLLIPDLFPHISLAMLNKVHYASSYSIWFFMPASLAVIYPGVFPRWFMRPLLIYTLGITVYVALTPAAIFRSLEWPDYVMMLICFSILIFTIRAVLEKKPGADVIFLITSCMAALVLVYAGTGDSSFIYNVVTSSGLFFGTIILVECIIVAQGYIETRNIEISSLKDQIRPHFVHNALAAIISISRKEPERSRDLLINFSTYLRGRFDCTSMDFISIEQELEMIKAYTALEQARFGNRIRVEYQIEVEGFLLPPLILQPLVENALVHGLQGEKAEVLVVVYTRYINKKVRIGVRDNGPGMMAGSTANTGRKGIALDNINRRLANIYGSQLQYLPSVNGGCEVYMEIPYKEVLPNESHSG